MTTLQPDRHTQRASFTPKRIADDGGDARSLRPSILFLGLALCLTLGIATWLGLVDTNDDIRLEITDVSTSSDGNVALTGARYRGHTESGKKFEVIATAAIEHPRGNLPARRRLLGPRGLLRLESCRRRNESHAGRVHFPGARHSA